MAKLVLLRPLTEDEKQQLEQISRSPTEPVRRVQRARIILSLAAGNSTAQIAQALSISDEMVRKQRQRFNVMGLNVLNRKPGSGHYRTRLEPLSRAEQTLEFTHTIAFPQGHKLKHLSTGLALR